MYVELLLYEVVWDFHVGLLDLLLIVLGFVVCVWCGGDFVSFVVDVESYGCYLIVEGMDVSWIFGWFIYVYLVWLDIGE